jgi:7,8-dihydropterin-6-yl-methyl-4-(beta-D-ribofuranosyl)aminobenzene 5'-phosphate synthase
MILKEVEKVEVTCLVDNNVDLLLPNTEVARRPVLARNWYEQPLIAEHGFCAALTLHLDGVKRRLLFDSGLDPFAASHNADVLLFDLSSCESLISSHGHIDHSGGLINLRNKMNTVQRITLVIHEDAFRNGLTIESSLQEKFLGPIVSKKGFLTIILRWKKERWKLIP